MAVPVGMGQLAVSVLDRRAPAGSFAADLSRAAGGGAVRLFGSGRAGLAALVGAWRSAGRDEVLLPGYICWSVPAAVVRAGLRVRLVDVDPATLDIDPRALERIPTARLVAAVAGHLCGATADVAALGQLRDRDGAVRIVEDAAQTWPAAAGSRADAVLLSFGRGKPLPLGGGGAVLLRGPNPALAAGGIASGGWTDAAALALTAVLARPAFYRLPASMPGLGIGATVFDPGFESDRPLHRWQERLGSRLLGRLPELTRRRERNAALLRERIAGRRGWHVPRGAALRGPVRLPVVAPSHEDRDRAVAALERGGIAASPMYPAALADVPALRPWLTDGEPAVPGSRDLARRFLTLPVYPTLSPRQLERIAVTVERVVEETR